MTEVLSAQAIMPPEPDPHRPGKGGQSSSTGAGCPPQGFISFVAFDGNSSDSTRKTIRKQAALASAAARKATIARKLAQQKEDAAKQPGSGKPSEPASLPTHPANGKRKRLEPQPAQSEGRCPSSVAREPPPAAEEHDHKRKRDFPQTILGLLSPQSTISEVDHQHSTPEDAGSSTTRTPCQCSSCRSCLSRNWQAALELLSRCERQDDHPRGRKLPAREEGHVTEEFALPLTPMSLPSPPSISVSKVDPFNSFPVDHHPVFDRLLHHMLTIFAPRGWPALKINRQEGLHWEWFMTQHALAEPALFLVRLLFASGDMIRLNALGPDVANWLRSLAIRAINDALSDRNRSVSDGLILAVGRIALHESMYGDRTAANTVHRPAQKRMIDLRGGMGALEFPPLVKRLMRWADNVMSMQSGSPRLLLDDDDLGNTTFGVKESVQVLVDWVPTEGQALRKKIAISDLIT